MVPLPKNIDDWFEEIRRVYAEAMIAVGKESVGLGYANNADLFPAYLVAPESCATMRGLSVDDAGFKRARKDALDLYEMNLPAHPQLTALPHLAFAFCYVVTHAACGIISPKDAAFLLDRATDFPAVLLPPEAPKKPSRKAATKVSPKAAELIRLTAEFCAKHLDDEYAALCENLIEKAGRKRVVPFESGQLASWAAGVVHALCAVNFGFDKTLSPHTTTSAIAVHFGVSANTAAQKSKKLRDMFDMGLWSPNPEFFTLHMLENNPLRKLGIL